MLEYHYQHNNKVVVKTEDEQQSAALNKGLWLISQKAFIPHAMKGHPLLEEQPIYITDTDERPNEASVLVYLDGAVERPVADASFYDILIYVFNQDDAGKCTNMLKLAQDHAKKGLSVDYRRQDEKGVWLKSVIDNG